MPNYYLKILATAAIACTTHALSAQWSLPVTKIPCGQTDGCINFVIGDTAYIGGGTTSQSLYKYHASSNKWITTGDLGGNDKRPFGFSFAVNGKGYIMGGIDDELWMYDPATGQWTQKASFGGGTRNAGFCFVLGNNVYVGGGDDGNGGFWNDFWKYDAASNQWIFLSTLPMGPIEFPACFVANGKAYVTTWLATDGTSVFEQNTLWEYDPAGSGKWTQKASFPGTARQCATAFALGNYGFVGGGQSGYTTVYKDMWRYDVTNDKWAQAEDFPMSTTAWSTAFVVKGTAYLGTGVSFASAGLIGTDNFYKYNSTLGVQELSQQIGSASVYPNPSADNVTIHFHDNKPAHISLYDITGRLVKDMGTTTARNFDVSMLDKGMYIIELNDGITKNTTKFIKQ
jgi:N-acetylneuraminic acid mutarotase